MYLGRGILFPLIVSHQTKDYILDQSITVKERNIPHKRPQTNEGREKRSQGY